MLIALGKRGSWSWKQINFSCHWRQKINVFCFVKYIWQPVSEGGSSIAEWLLCLRFSVYVHTESRDAQSTQKRETERRRLDCMGKQAPTGILALFHACIGILVCQIEEFVLDPFRHGRPVTSAGSVGQRLCNLQTLFSAHISWGPRCVNEWASSPIWCVTTVTPTEL